jgi:hypothetical protein
MRAGAARVSIEPPLDLPMVGFVRQWQTASGYGLPLEATALAIESRGTAVVLIGVDTVGIQSPEVDRLRERVGGAIDVPPENVLLNWSHTHLAPPGGRSLISGLAQVDDEEAAARCAAYVDFLHAKIVTVAQLAAATLEEARVVWGMGNLDEAVNRRERRPDGGGVILGWNPDGMVDTTVPVMQARRADETPIATLVGYGCHTVASGPDVLVYSSDFAGALRDEVRRVSGGECVYFQAAAGNVLPRTAFTDSEREAVRIGRSLAHEAMHAVSARSAWPYRYERTGGGSVTPFSLYRRVPEPAADQELAVAEQRVTFPLLALPSAAEIAGLRARYEQLVEQEEHGDADPARLRILRYDSRWAALTESAVAGGRAPTAVDGTLSAVRIGDGVIVTAPGEIFSEIGMAVKEGSPADVTLYAGYTNGLISYFPTADEYPLGGYEPGYGNRTFGLPAQVSPQTERILVQTGTHLARELFPDRQAPVPEGSLPSGRPPTAPAPDTHERPS